MGWWSVGGEMNKLSTNLLIFLSFWDYLAVSLVAPQVGLRIRELGASQLVTGLISSAYGAIQLLSSTPHGVACDRYGRRVVMVTCSALVGLLYFILGCSGSFLSLFAIRSALGLLKHTQANLKIIGGDISTGVARSVFVSRINSVSGLAFMIGPLLTSLFPKETVFTYSTTLCGTIFLGVSLMSYLTVPETLKPGALETKKQQATPFFERLHKYRRLRVVFLFRFFAALSVIILRYFTPLYTMHYLGFNVRKNSYMTSFVGFSGVVCASFAGYLAKWVPDKRQLTRYTSLLLVFSIASSLLATSMTGLLLTQFLLSLATQNLRIVIDAILLASVGDGDRGEVFGVGASVVSLCRVGGPVVAGALADFHMMAPLMASLGFAVAAAVVWWVGVGEERNEAEKKTE